MKTPGLIVSNAENMVLGSKQDLIWKGRDMLSRSPDSKKGWRVASPPLVSLTTHRKFFSNYSALQKLRS